MSAMVAETHRRKRLRESCDIEPYFIHDQEVELPTSQRSLSASSMFVSINACHDQSVNVPLLHDSAMFPANYVSISHFDDPDNDDMLSEENDLLDQAPSCVFSEDQQVSYNPQENASASAGNGTPVVHFNPDVVLSVPKDRRIFKKRPAAGTPYEALAVTGNQSEQRRRIAIIKSINAQNHSSRKVVAAKALATVRKRIGEANQLVDRFGQEDIEYDSNIIDRAHVSHNIKSVHNHPNAFYCDHCGAWSTGGSNLKSLSVACSGQVVKSRAFQLRLLQVGVIPKPGATIPVHARKKRKLRYSHGPP